MGGGAPHPDAGVPALDLGAVDGQPNPARAARMERAADAVAGVLAPLGVAPDYSVLGPGWSSDVDVYAGEQWATAMNLAREAGWIPLDGLFTHLGYPGRGRWAVVADGVVLARCDLQPGTPPPPGVALEARARRNHAVGLREALEARLLVGRRNATTRLDPEILAAAARIEAALGGQVLADHLDGPAQLPPVALQGSSPPRLGRLRRRLRPRLAVALSGVDGSGKSTLVAALTEALEGCGVPASVVWTRPGMRLRALERLASVAKRLLGVRQTGLRQLAEGADPEEIVSRRGAVGWVWSLLVTVSYLWDVNRRSRNARSVVVFDRHLLDALATIRTLYGSVNTRLQEWLVRRLCPPAAVTLWLDLPAAAATARKPDDLMNPSLVAQQLQRYAELAGEVPHLRRLDATAPADTVVLDALRSLDTELQQRRGGWRARLASLRR